MTVPRTVATSAAWGFLAGALFACAVMWGYGDAIESLAARVRLGPASGALDRWNGAIADADAPRRPGKPVATSGSIAAPARAVIAPAPPPELVARHLEVPVQGVRREDLVRSFDDRRDGSRPHEAIDILAPRNTSVRAVEDGTIAKLFNSKAGGITVYQFDPDGRFCYYYAHLERYADGLTEGAHIKRGQTLGYVGTSGNAPKGSPHLHFAVFRLNADRHWWEGTPIDPYTVLR
jgi:peptidoglycan LD-endopeptidase LytH